MSRLCTGKKPFFFHFNKPLSQSRGRPTISVHYDGACHFVDNVNVLVPTAGKISNKQPRFVMRGCCTEVTFRDGIAVIQ